MELCLQWLNINWKCDNYNGDGKWCDNFCTIDLKHLYNNDQECTQRPKYIGQDPF